MTRLETPVRTDTPELLAPTRSGPCVAELLETRRFMSASLPAITGHFGGNLFFDQNGAVDHIDLQITDQRNARIAGTFVQDDGSAGIFAGSFNRRGILTFTYQSTNLYNNYKGKVRAGMNFNGTSLTSFSGDFITRLGRAHAAGTFSVQRIGPDLNQKSG